MHWLRSDKFRGSDVFRTYQTDLPLERWPTINAGRNRWRCRIPKGLLNGGDLLVNPRIGIHNVSWIVHEDAVLQFRINLRHGRIAVVERCQKKSPGFDRTDSGLDACGSLNAYSAFQTV